MCWGRTNLARMRLVQLMVKLVYLLSSFPEGLLSRRRDAIDAPGAAASVARNGLEQSAALHPVQKRIKSSRPDAIAVMGKLLHHRQSKDGLMARVQQHVNADQPVKKFLLETLHRKHYTALHEILP